MWKSALFLAFFSFSLMAEPQQLIEIKKGKLYFKDGSVYLLNKDGMHRFLEKAIGQVFQIERIEKSERKRSFDTEIKNRLGSFKAKRIADKTKWREARLLEKHRIEKAPVVTAPPVLKKKERLSVVLQKDRTLRLSDGTAFEAQTLLPTRGIEGEDVVLEKVEFYQLRTKAGEKILLKQIRK